MMIKKSYYGNIMPSEAIDGYTQTQQLREKAKRERERK